MAREIENLEDAFEEMFDFITDLPSGLDGFESDFDLAFQELEELKATLTQLNEPLRCTGCMYLDEDFVPCVHCVRAAGYADYYRRPPEGEEDT